MANRESTKCGQTRNICEHSFCYKNILFENIPAKEIIFSQKNFLRAWQTLTGDLMFPSLSTG